MKILLSPAKKINFDHTMPQSIQSTRGLFEKEANYLVSILKQYSLEEIQSLMSLSSDLALLNYERFQNWHFDDNLDVSNAALWSFRGEVFSNLEVETLSSESQIRANKMIRVLSGLYGYLRPSDLIQAYRLEMGTKLSFDHYKNLYAYWKEKNTTMLNEELKQEGTEPIVINLASKEYSKSIDFKKVEARVITPEFKDLKGDKYKVVSFWAKRARGLMARFIVENNICNSEDLLGFSYSGYYYKEDMSTIDNPVFVRDH